MSIPALLRVIGRGERGARALSSADAEALMADVLDARASPAQTAAFAMAMRMKGETLHELQGFLAAAHARCLVLDSDRPVVLLPSYNGARRLPNLTPLLALRLAQEGLRVLVHGVQHDDSRITSAEILRDLGLPPAADAAEVLQRWRRHEPAFLPVDRLCPPLAGLLALRQEIGVRNSGHTIAKMLDPIAGAIGVRVINHTHPAFGELMAAHARQAPGALLLLRGTEGEPVADARRRPRMDGWLGGMHRQDLSCPPQEGSLAALPLLPSGGDAAGTAHYVQAVLSGATPSPGPIEAQVALLARTVVALRNDDEPAQGAPTRYG